MKKITFLLAGIAIFTISCIGQIGGNSIYGTNSRPLYDDNRTRPAFKSQPGLYIDRDSILYINVNILQNKEADYYLLVLGANQTASNSKEAMATLNQRIEKFIASIPPGLHIKEKDIYVDFISQTKIFDYQLNTNAEKKETVASQKQLGFQTKKNILLKFTNLKDMDILITKAAEQDIYDIVKVDYIVTDNQKVYREMMDEAIKIANTKKELYLKSSNIQLDAYYHIQNDNFYSIYPGKQYVPYQAFETGNVNYSSDYYHQGSFIKKDMLMDKTFYFLGQDPADFDLVINPGTPRVGLQYILNYTIKYIFRKKQ